MQEIVITPTWRDRVEEALARTREHRLLVGLVAGVAALSLFLWGRSPAPRVAPPAQAAAVPVATASSASVIVHVAGAVRHPGLYEFPSGARIADAIQTAGGALRTADLDALNLAELLIDGVQISVPRRTDGPNRTNVPAAPTSPAPIAINSADEIALETVPGIGPVTAAAIVAHRERVGGFASIDELLDVDGIGPATLEAIRPYLTL